MATIRNAVKDATKREFAGQFKVELCTVHKVKWYKSAGWPDVNVFDVVIRDRRKKRSTGGSGCSDGSGNKKDYIREDVVMSPQAIANCGGIVNLPRRGDLVRVLFYQNKFGMILGPVTNGSEKPPVMQSPYDRIDKWGQWQAPKQDEDLDFVRNSHPQIKLPICHKIHHGPPDGKCGKGRDEIDVHECAEGDANPCCCDCLNIDSVCECGNTWTKRYSSETMADCSKNDRWHFHHKSGSHFLFEKSGHLLLENGVRCTTTDCPICGRKKDIKKGHLEFDPYGSVDIHSDHDETKGTRCKVYAVDDPSTIAGELINLTTGAYVRIMKSGEIALYSPTKITLDAPEVEATHHMTIGSETVGSCSHGACSCGGCGGASAGTGTQQAIEHGLTDSQGAKAVPSVVSCLCTCAGGSCSCDYVDDTYIYVTCTINVTFKWTVRL